MQHTTICLADAPRPDSGAPLPERLLLLKDGDNPAGDGAVYRVDERTYEALSAQIEAGVFARLVIDFNHQSVKGHPNYTPDPRSHAGYGKLEAVPGEGVFLSAIEWTEEGKAHRADYPDLSPAILTAPDADPDGAKSVRGLVSVAVCTNGMLADGPRCLSAEMPDDADALRADKSEERKEKRESETLHSSLVSRHCAAETSCFRARRGKCRFPAP